MRSALRIAYSILKSSLSQYRGFIFSLVWLCRGSEWLHGALGAHKNVGWENKGAVGGYVTCIKVKEAMQLRCRGSYS